ncbi:MULTISPECIES: galactokinase [unclassified Lentimicrobium]|uniref:galactokinase n=1 Tax=unclassified Lentimicrobium TaxID=2677434 RepID=UPI001555E380|nr:MULTISPECIES: galactokinase [unclassified Lentimicrobium]NPD44613.1 galactokinase [Lentimicrobium sp. S6]NPD83325.1 galactokinase [Lentimicrobium sp. L6]
MKQESSLLKHIEAKFEALYQNTPRLFLAPGRINIIGEHTDYNDGFVLPAAIDKHIAFAVAKNDLNCFRFYSMDFHELEEVNCLELGQDIKLWAQYLIGVLAQFEKIGKLDSGFDMVFGGNIPVGAGLSSSAALECGLAKAVNVLSNLQLSDIDLVKLAQKAEHEYAGVMCGIMDQYASVFGKKNQVFKLDCRDNTHQYFPLELHDYELLLINTNVKHSLASSEYNLRREECERGVQYFKTFDSNITALRKVSLEMIEAHEDKPDPVSYKRSKYMVEEIARVGQATQALANHDLKTLGQLLYQTHDGLSKLYEVSCPELDFLVDLTRPLNQILGSRMMGGGFGGCTLNLIKKSFVSEFKEIVDMAYEKQFSKKPDFYEVHLSDGAREVF